MVRDLLLHKLARPSTASVPLEVAMRSAPTCSDFLRSDPNDMPPRGSFAITRRKCRHHCQSKCDWQPTPLCHNTTPPFSTSPARHVARAGEVRRVSAGQRPSQSRGSAGPAIPARPRSASANGRPKFQHARAQPQPTTCARMSRSTIHDLLNSGPRPAAQIAPYPTQRVDASTTLRSLLGPFGYHAPQAGPFLVSTDTHRLLQNLLASWTPPQLLPPPHRAPPPPPPPPLQPAPNATRTAECDVRLAKGSKLSVLYHYQPGVPVEYPESGAGAPVGHLIPMTPGTHLPWVDFAYSQGHPDGGSAKRDVFFTPLLVDQHGQGIKACPLADLNEICGPAHWHTSATREDVERRLAAARDARQRLSTPHRDIFLHTSAYITALRQLGCRRPRQQDTVRTGQELQHYEREQELAEHFRRGYSAPQTCAGRIVYHEFPDPDNQKGPPRAYLSCEHYSRRTPDHWADFGIQDGGYDIDYIAAYFTGDSEEVARIEQAAAAENIGPMASCTTLRNHSAQTLHCPVDHRVDGRLAQVELCRIDCDVKFRVWFPTNLQDCPFVLVTSQGVHRHPIPLPEKTPQVLRSQILQLLRTLRQDLPDMTPRRLLRHPALQSYLIQTLPDQPTATLSTLHPSLANRAHLAAYIAKVREEHFPYGTDWKGILHLKRLQDEQLPVHQHYIRLVLDLDNATLAHHDEDDEPAPPGEKRTRMVICMSADSSARLQKTQSLGWTRDANTSVVFCRVYLTRHTAAAHQIIFQEINKIVDHDTGRPLQWRHLHGRHPDDFAVGLILHWGADQHRGQAKGLGLHLVERAAELPIDRMDMHEPQRSLRSLGPYDHLRRIYRVCKVHNYRNIQQCAVPEHVRHLMRSLACIRHHDWQGTIDKILHDGGKAAKDWINDKESCGFAFPGICWERSFIPLPVWQAGEPNTNLVEVVHRDANRDGVHCTLVGGLLRGQAYDDMQRATIVEYEAHGIRPSYDAVTPITNALKNVIRRANGRTNKLHTTALAVSTHNTNIRACHQKLRQAISDYDHLRRALSAPHLQTSTAQTALKHQIATATLQARKAANAYDRQVRIGETLRAGGSEGVVVLDLLSF
ncbi:hypothetical protein B0H14DRAFT_2561582 [Mycena olivaceomarginata]|nr:hypothetical protein B0H14DRAFT_2561582 [Mycena olivaceomarginata]